MAASDEPLLSKDGTNEFFTSRPGFLRAWDFPGWGVQRVMRYGERTRHASLSSEENDIHAFADPPERHGASLTTLQATALSGNDLLGSCLYAVGLTIATAGWMAPFSLLAVVVMLYLFRFIYSEAVMALPVNGGCYSLLLNGTSKPVAAGAAVLTLLSYVATAVVSATEAARYALSLSPAGAEGWAVQLFALCLLGFACILVILGVGESAQVSVVIFVVHISVLFILIGYCIAFAANDQLSTLTDNFHTRLPSEPEPTSVPSPKPTAFSTALAALFLGFGQASLGVSGFESSANTIEEQEKGIFPSVLRNMWIAVSFFNPILSVAVLATVPLSVLQEDSGGALLLAAEYSSSRHSWFYYVVAIDATIVLAGGVLTGFVGVSGLARRMSLDRCLPSFLLAINSWRGTMHYIPITFFLLTASLTLIVTNVEDLSGVYSLAFLGVMCLFAIGVLILKRTRSSLPRPVKTWPSTAMAAAAFVIVALAAIIVHTPNAVRFFALYAIGTSVIVYGMLYRAPLLAFFLPGILSALRKMRSCCCCCREWGEGWIDFVTYRLVAMLRSLRDQPIVIFAKHADLVALNKALLYTRKNEQTSRICVVHVLEQGNTGRRATEALRRQLHPAATLTIPSTNSDSSSTDPSTLYTTSMLTASTDSTTNPTPFGASHPTPSPQPSSSSSSSSTSGSSAGAAAAPVTEIGGGGVVQSLLGKETGRKLSNSVSMTSVRTLSRPTTTHADAEGGMAKGHHSHEAAAAASALAAREATRVFADHQSQPSAALEEDVGVSLDDETEGLLRKSDDEYQDVESGAPAPFLLFNRLKMEEIGDELDPNLEDRLVETEVPELAAECQLLDVIYPKVRVDLLVIKGAPFGRDLIEELSQVLHISSNLMFIFTPDKTFSETIASLGGVRVIVTPSRPLPEKHKRLPFPSMHPSIPTKQPRAPTIPKPAVVEVEKEEEEEEEEEEDEEVGRVEDGSGEGGWA